MLSLVLVGLAVAQLALPFTADLPVAPALMPHRQRLVIPALQADFAEILRRPIFAADRRPMTETMDGFVLLGTGAVGNIYTALLKAGVQVIRAHVGDTVQGWRITSLASDRALFERDAEKRMLLLDLKSRRAATKPPPVVRSQ
jgi:hypothetical protein